MVEMHDVLRGVNRAEAKIDVLFGCIARLEVKLDALLAALAEDAIEATEPEYSLDGDLLTGERDQRHEL